MKPFGSILEFKKQRNSDLMRAYRLQLHKSTFIRMRDISAIIVNMPASRFWVSEERAASVISSLLAGKPLPQNMLPTKKEMFLEILRRVKKLRKLNPASTFLQIISEVVNSPAPKFYMKPRFAMDIIYKMKNGYYERLYHGNPRWDSQSGKMHTQGK